MRGARPGRAARPARARPPRRGSESDLADEPLGAADRLLGERGAVDERPGALLDLPARDRRRVPDARGASRRGARDGLEALARLEASRAAACAVRIRSRRYAARRVAVDVPRVHVPVRQPALDRRTARRPRHDLVLARASGTRSRRAACSSIASGERRDQVLLGRRPAAPGSAARSNCAERLLELRADAVERRVRAGGDHRPDELEREPDRARLERRQPRRAAERVAEELLVDVHLVAVQLGVDGVAAAAEVDEVEQREVLLELPPRGIEKRSTSSRAGMTALALLAAGGEQVGEQRLQDAEALGRDRARPGARRASARPRDALLGGGRRRRRPRARARAARTPSATSAAQRGGLERDGAAVLAQDPARRAGRARRTR